MLPTMTINAHTDLLERRERRREAIVLATLRRRRQTVAAAGSVNRPIKNNNNNSNSSRVEYKALSDRRVMRRRIRNIVASRLPASVSRSAYASQCAAAIESCLYKTSAGIEDYSDLSQLERRVALLSASVARRQAQLP